MENQRNTSNLKAIIVILAVLLVGSLGYMYKMSSDAKETQTTLLADKSSIQKELEELKKTYDKAIAENTSMSDELIAEREKVVRLMADLEKSKGDAAAMRKYRDQFFKLQSEMKRLMAQVDELKAQNVRLTTQRDSTLTVLDSANRYNQVLIGQNEELSKTIEIGSKLTVTNLKTGAYKLRSSGKQVETDKARRADILKVSFTIAENKIAKQGDKTYYIQVIDSRNNVLGEKKTATFGDQTLTYSFPVTVNYENKSVNVSEDLPGNNFEKGTYFVNVFDGNELVSKSSFVLK